MTRKPELTRDEACRVALQIFMSGQTSVDAIKRSRIPMQQVVQAMDDAHAAYVRPVHAIRPTGCVLKEWRR